MKVAVLGAGVNGLCCAVQISEIIESAEEVTIIADALTPNTTGDGSAGFWGPYLLGNTPAEKIHKWSKQMHEFLEEIWLSQNAATVGVCLIPVLKLSTRSTEDEHFWKDIVYGYRSISQKELDYFNRNQSKKYTHGVHYLTYTSEPIKLLPYLMDRFKRNGGSVLLQKIDDLEKFAFESCYDVVINCTGLGAKNLLSDDEMYPVRGQVSCIEANWVRKVVFDDSESYIIPNTNWVILGGTHQENDLNTDISNEDKNMIIDRCQHLQPDLRHAAHLFDWVGLRPGRVCVRLELNELGNGKVLIHNYGHGGSGVTLAWGCATEVVELLMKFLKCNKKE